MPKQEYGCPVCGNVFQAYLSQKRKTCSLKCARHHLWDNPEYQKKMSEAHLGQKTWMKGKKHSPESILKMRRSSFNGKERILRNGYIFCYCPEHPRAINGRVPEQVLIAERTMGRYLRPNEVVHHINGCKADNRNCNLLVCTSTYHKALHAKMGEFGVRKTSGLVVDQKKVDAFVKGGGWQLDGFIIEEVLDTSFRV